MGVTKTIIKEGSGPSPQVGQTVVMKYTGYLKDATITYNDYQKDDKRKPFDTTKQRGPFETAIGVGRVIKGWDEGVPQMKVGEEAVLDITSDYGYGARGAGDVIPAHADLIFFVELLEIKN
ncbi:FKBP-type peptidyl-prolyl cis-trans isomerase [Dactylonectria macrodidyma]|uniref:peptidylprolyl isomerase n=1 Tax=Dactylonectria macrodidyma TaxID=307937 RepID=A0A9P9FGR3_9HYPO|nr:FKBP-type peptidyl-prolyl cis-trans isomerase [Dactylonectria macrodidyma]